MKTPEGNGSEMKWFTHKLIMGLSSVLFMLLIAITAFAFARIDNNAEDIKIVKEEIDNVELKMVEQETTLKFIESTVIRIEEKVDAINKEDEKP